MNKAEYFSRLLSGELMLPATDQEIKWYGEYLDILDGHVTLDPIEKIILNTPNYIALNN